MVNCVSCKRYLYAADAQNYLVVINDEPAAELRNDLEALWIWTQGSLLKFNSTKFHQLTLTRRSKRPARCFNFYGDKPLTNVEREKDLGVNVDSRLSFNEHIAKKVKEANCLVAIIKNGFEQH